MKIEKVKERLEFLNNQENMYWKELEAAARKRVYSSADMAMSMLKHVEARRNEVELILETR